MGLHHPPSPSPSPSTHASFVPFLTNTRQKKETNKLQISQTSFHYFATAATMAPQTTQKQIANCVENTKTLEFERKQVASDLANEPDWEDEEPDDG
jgi:hypothetical protein